MYLNIIYQTFVNMQIQFNSESEMSRHSCNARRDGDWAIFTCPLCPGFERRMNLRTGAMRVQEASDASALHEGFFVPVGLEQSNSLPN